MLTSVRKMVPIEVVVAAAIVVGFALGWYAATRERDTRHWNEESHTYRRRAE